MAIGEKFDKPETRHITVTVEVAYTEEADPHIEFSLDKIADGLYDVPGIESAYVSYDSPRRKTPTGTGWPE
jgi:hypothetical protein